MFSVSLPLPETTSVTHSCPLNPELFTGSLPDYLPCTVAVSLALLPLHQPHGSQGLPVSLCWGAALHRTSRPSPPVTVAPPSFHLHGDRLTILIHIVQLLPAMVVRRFMSLGLTRGNGSDQSLDCCDA